MILEENLSPLLLHVTKPQFSEATPYLLERIMQPLYLKYTPNVKGSIFICAQVLTDGNGDYISLIKAAKVLQKSHPLLQVEVVFTYAKKLPEIDTSGLLLHPFLEHPEKQILEPILEGQPAEELSAEAILAEAIYERMKNALAIIHIAIALNTFDNPLLASKSLYFAEAGNFMGYKNSLKYNWYSLGLSPVEEGIFLEMPFVRKDRPDRYLGYIPKSEAQQITFRNLINLIEKGKEVEIVSPTTPLPYLEFQKILCESGALVGCTGDGSLAECLAIGKIPYYEIRAHKSKTLEDLIRLSLLLGLKDIEEYFHVMTDVENEPSGRLYEILCRPNFQESWDKIIAFIHSWCKLENSLIARVRRILFSCQTKEAELAELIVNEKISFDEAFETMEKHLKEQL